MEKKEEYLNLLKEAETKKELILLYFKTSKYYNRSFDILRSVYKQIDRKEAKMKNIVEKIVETFTKNECTYEKILEICEKEDIIINNVETILTEEINKTVNSDIYRMILNTIRYHLTENIIIKKEEEKANIDYSIAKNTMELYLSSTADLKENFTKKTNCSQRWFNTALNILRVKSHPLYYKFIERKKEIKDRKNSDFIAIQNKRHEEMEKNMEWLSKDEILDILKLSVNSEKFKVFCSYHNILPHLLKMLITKEENFIQDFITDFNVYYIYEEQYKNIYKDIIKDVVIAYKTNNKKPLNLYEYYQKSNLRIEDLRDDFLTIRGDIITSDIKNKGLLGNYISTNLQTFKAIDSKTLEIIKKMSNLTCGNTTITYDRVTLMRALKDIEENNIPLNKGTLYGAIKHQKELVKKK